MRHLPVLCAVAILPACASSTLDDPRIRLSPYLAVYQLRGKMGMQSPGDNPGDPPQDRPQQDMRSFGQDHHREDVGGRLDIGDGFAGFRIDYYRLDMGSGRPGTLYAPFGNLAYGDEVTLHAAMDDVRLGWIEPLWHHDYEYRDRPVHVQLGAGGVFAYRQLAMDAHDEQYLRYQNVDVGGNVLFGAVRARVGYGDFAFDLDWAISPDLALGGDFGGLQQDLEGILSYQPQRDIRVFAGYRYSQMPATGGAGPFHYDADLTIDGYQLGVSITF